MDLTIEHIFRDDPFKDEGPLPQTVLGATIGSLKELEILARIWTALLEPLSIGIHLIFLRYLDSSKVSTEPRPNIAGVTKGVEEGRAFWALWGLGKLSELFPETIPDNYAQDFVKAWPGIFKWSAFFFTSRLQVPSINQSTDMSSPQRCLTRRLFRDLIAGSWCSLAFSKSTRKVMLETPGAMDIAARLWVFEGDSTLDVPRAMSYGEGAPMASQLWDLLSGEEGINNQLALNSILSAVGGDTGRIAQTALGRLTKAFKASNFSSESQDSTIILSLIGRLGFQVFPPNPEVLQAFLDGGIIPVCIKLLIQIASAVNNRSSETDSQENFVTLMMLAYKTLVVCLDVPIGRPWVLQAINAGLLTAFVECSPLYGDLKLDDYTTVSQMIADRIPTYLAYFTVVQAMDKAFMQLEKTERVSSLRKTRAWTAFNDLALLTARRFAFSALFKEVKKQATRQCGNPKCKKVNVRSNFRRCAKCQITLYCSRECQFVDWKEFNHKKDCEPTKDWDISRRDAEYLQVLNLSEVRHHRHDLRRLASTEHPGVPLHDLMVVIDYNVAPTTRRVDLYSTWSRNFPKMFPVSRNDSTTHAVSIVPHEGTDVAKYHPTAIPDDMWDPFMDPLISRSDKDSLMDGEARRKLYGDV
ncbi:hypothetical protein BDN72DRAFT_846539 [Pluteus cervinus]|uniref:Uncharacterized protein n=1 Tax=Pluteus cervinus TaxID=181527 RepID=A0ACD3AFU7_9AGAR|nr:hypothetical protein BDN72DRAFT_846539 [Pluteus cervinus]